MIVAERDELGFSIMSAAERFCQNPNVNATSKRLLFEFLALPGDNGKTLSGLCKPGAQPSSSSDVLGITRRWMGFHGASAQSSRPQSAVGWVANRRP